MLIKRPLDKVRDKLLGRRVFFESRIGYRKVRRLQKQRKAIDFLSLLPQYLHGVRLRACRCVESSFEDYLQLLACKDVFSFSCFLQQLQSMISLLRNVCWICREESEEWDMWLSCHHIFCARCSSQMLLRRMPCPLCRVASTTVLRGGKCNASLHKCLGSFNISSWRKVWQHKTDEIYPPGYLEGNLYTLNSIYNSWNVVLQQVSKKMEQQCKAVDETDGSDNL